MNSTLLRMLAAIMAIGAVAMAWLGYSISTQPTPQATTQQAPATYPQLVAARDLPAGYVLNASDVKLESLPQRDPAALTSVQQAIGKLTLHPIANGAPVLSSHFPVLGPVAQSLYPQERAIAVKVNEVIGVGGFISPGDHVDVLLYLRGDRETDNTSSAQVVLSNVRVLAYGEEISATNGNEDATANSKEPSINDLGKSETTKASSAKSAILAVPEQDVSRLMLADNSGLLRLALRGASPPEALAAKDTRHFLRLDEIGKLKPNTPIVTASVKQPVRKKTASSTSNNKGSQVIVHHGDRVEVVKLSN